MRAVISGYYGFGNIGDEAILQSLIALLKSECEDIEIVVLSKDPAATSKEYGISAVKRDNPVCVVREVAASHLFFNGGGGIIQDVTGRWSPAYYLSLWQLAHVWGKRTWVWGQGVGPLNSKFYWWWLKYLLQSTDVIGVRDSYSYNVVRALGIDEEKLYISEDLVFAFPRVPSSKNSIDAPIAIVIRKWGGVRDFVNRLIPELKVFGRKLVVMTFSKGDEAFLKEVIGDVGGVEAVIPKSVDDAFGLISGMSAVVGMRLHSLVFSSLVSVPFVGISYDPKVSSFSDRMGMEYFPLDVSSIGGIVMAVRRLYDNYDEYITRLLFEVGSAKKRCKENFSIAWKRWQNETGDFKDI